MESAMAVDTTPPPQSPPLAAAELPLPRWDASDEPGTHFCEFKEKYHGDPLDNDTYKTVSEP